MDDKPRLDQGEDADGDLKALRNEEHVQCHGGAKAVGQAADQRISQARHHAKEAVVKGVEQRMEA